jgi:hypothetical protein
MNQIETLRPDREFLLSWKISQKLDVILRADLPRVSHGFGCKVFVRQRALRINVEPYRMIMVSADRNRRATPDPLNHLMWSRAIVD